MSSLSWLIYLIGLSDNIGNYFGFITVPVFFMAAVLTITKLIWVIDGGCEKLQEKYGKSLRNWVISLWISAFSLIAIYILIPNRQTAILIAGSEIGQRVLQNDQVQAAGNRVANGVFDPSISLLQTWMKKETMNQQNQLDDLIHNHEQKK